MAILEGNFLESILPVQAFAHLTTQHRMAQHRLEEAYSVWIRELQAHNRVTLGWIMSIENAPQRHIHAALVAASPLDCPQAEQIWEFIAAPRYSEAAKVKPYQGGICGLSYVLKELNSSAGDVRFSGNLNAFAPHLTPVCQTNSAQKRQARRIRAQLERAFPHFG